MADKNFARSGTADTDLLADDDPLSELARLVGYEPRPVKDVAQTHVKSSSEPLDSVPRRENPVLALEDELMRAFEQYDAPSRAAEKPAARPVEPVFEEAVPVVEDRAAIIDEAPVRHNATPVAAHREPSFAETVFEQPVEAEPVFEADSSLLLADELEAAVNEVPAIEAEPVVHAGRQFADRFEPRFETPVRQEPVADVMPVSRSASEANQPEFLGFQPMVADDVRMDDLSVDLERELELSIGDGFADDLVAEATFVEPQPVVVETVESNAEPTFQELISAEAEAEPFQSETSYAKDEPHFVADLTFDSREERARVAAEVESQWQAQEPVFDAAPDYRVESVETVIDDRDALLADVERFPVPEARTPFTGESRNPANIASIFGRRATPTVNQQRDPVMSAIATPVVQKPVEKVEPAPVAEIRPVVEARPAAVAEPEIDFESMEFDLSDIELDLSDIVLDDVPAKVEAKPAVVKPVEAKPVDVKAAVAKPVEVQTPVRREPAVAVPVSTYTAVPQPVVAEMADGSLPFDPTMIADTDEGVSPVTELDVPQLPVIEKEKPPVVQPDYEFDIDAEMAQLFTEPAAKPTRRESLQAGVAAGAVAAAAQPVAQMNDVDDFERALEEDFRRSLSQPERMAIPVDPGQATQLYGGDGYDDEQSRPRRGLLIAASIAGLLLIGGGGVYAWSAFTGGGAAGSGEPRVILADKDPVKVVPAEKGGKTVPNQDKAVYDRVAGDNASTPQQEQLVTSTEEPVDVVQRTLTPEALPDDGVDTPATAEDDSNRLLPGVDEPETATADGKPLVSPRKVKTMIVKPDGTLVAREDIVSEPSSETAGLDAKATATTAATSGEASATANATLDADASLRAEQNATDGQPRSALAEVATAEVDDTAPVRTVKTTTIGATAGTTTEGTSTDGKAPVPVTRPVDQPVTVVGTVTENGNVSGTETASATQTQQTAEQTQVAAVAPGSYVIQIASVPSEADAQKTYKNLSSKFGSVIGGRGVDIKKAEIPNKGTFFRIRIPAGSREEANALCSRYKGAGGSCLVTR
ncbi:SPOR domain-containing protein [Shinella sp.]|uniref:SPOR domain-containing protein n=1 Tax=Shinella sp. TaxID=1870904 RepID=UPI0028A76124|nr:SPOR domain-containing protein [Shinella sp.]